MKYLEIILVLAMSWPLFYAAYYFATWLLGWRSTPLLNGERHR